MESSNFIDIVKYNDAREIDTQYRDALKAIIDSGKDGDTVLDIQSGGETVKSNASARSLSMLVMRFDLRNGFPISTDRNLTKAHKGALGELIGFINGGRLIDELEEFGMPRFWWEGQITTEKTSKRGLAEGDLGDGSYGPAYHDFPYYKAVEYGSNDTVNRQVTAETFDVMHALVEQIRHRPELRTHVATTTIPPYIYRAPGYEQKTVVVPCHGSYLHFRVDKEKETIDLNHLQRSGDMPVGVQFNMVQYAALLMMVGHVTGYTPRNLNYAISDAHIYENQHDIVEELLEREPRPYPKMLVADVPSNAESLDKAQLKDFRPTDFELEEYDPHPFLKTPTTI